MFWMHGSTDALGRDVLTKEPPVRPVSMLIT
jgi:hypothetical protein